jgi:hypothetical protein
MAAGLPVLALLEVRRRKKSFFRQPPEEPSFYQIQICVMPVFQETPCKDSALHINLPYLFWQINPRVLYT